MWAKLKAFWVRAIGVIAAVFMAATQVSASDASSNLGSWFALVGWTKPPEKVFGLPLDTFGFGCGILVLVALLIWLLVPSNQARPGLKLTYDPEFAFGAPHGPGVWQACVVQVSNVTDRLLTRCQVRLFVSRNGKPIGRQRLFMGRPFNMRSHEELRVSAFEIPFDQWDGHAVIRPFHEAEDGTWNLNPSFPTLAPGTYDITVRAYCDETPPGQIKLRLAYQNGWKIAVAGGGSLVPPRASKPMFKAKNEIARAEPSADGAHLALAAANPNDMPLDIAFRQQGSSSGWAGLSDDRELDAWAIQYGPVLLTNLSKTDRLILDIELRLFAPDSADFKLIASDVEPGGRTFGGNIREILHAAGRHTPEFFRSPFTIEPQTSVEVKLIFLTPVWGAELMYKLLPRFVQKDGYNYSLVITDRISGRSIEIPVADYHGGGSTRS